MSTLAVGYKASDLFEKGKHGKVRTVSWADADTVFHALDIYHRHAIEKTHHLKTIASAHLPEGQWDTIRFRTGPKIMSGELSLDLLQEISEMLGGQLKPPRFILDFVGKESDRLSLLEKVTGKGNRHRDFSSKWTASVPGSEKIELVSFPGCFCHRRVDEGGLALAEIVSRDMPQDAKKFLDMGCGAGTVGFLVSAVHKDISLVMVDSHTRAVEAATYNAKSLGKEDCEVILSDNGTPERMDGTFDVFAGNPPYYSDYRIADVFLETASRALKKGGVCYTVCKNAAGLEPVQAKYFDSVEIIPRRGYSVLKSIK
jgi:16S rRNA (guanine1207-N2)-methyltransferase